MCDPWFMLILMQHLGREYIVWDKAASIQFVKPGRGTVTATFHLPPETIEAIRTQADVVDEQGEVVAKVEKRLYVRKKE